MWIVLKFVTIWASAVQADVLDGERRVSLQATDGTQIEIATLSFSKGQYSVQMADEPFADHFLSMRPFKCLEGPEKQWCHVPYPYEIARNAGPKDLTDIEYDFLFLWKRSGEYGIDMWNGVYYRLSVEDGRLIGRLHEMDMNILSAPPDSGNMRPIRAIDLSESDPESHWLPVLVIE